MYAAACCCYVWLNPAAARLRGVRPHLRRPGAWCHAGPCIRVSRACRRLRAVVRVHQTQAMRQAPNKSVQSGQRACFPGHNHVPPPPSQAPRPQAAPAGRPARGATPHASAHATGQAEHRSMASRVHASLSHAPPRRLQSCSAFDRAARGAPRCARRPVPPHAAPPPPPPWCCWRPRPPPHHQAAAGSLLTPR